jgi:hypothetical protein
MKLRRTSKKKRPSVTRAKARPVTMTLMSSSGMSAEVPVPTTLEQWQTIIGGYIEAVYLRVAGGKRAVMVVDEEGLLKRLPPNHLASMLAGGLICGPAALLTGRALKKWR